MSKKWLKSSIQNVGDLRHAVGNGTLRLLDSASTACAYTSDNKIDVYRQVIVWGFYVQRLVQIREIMDKGWFAWRRPEYRVAVGPEAMKIQSTFWIQARRIASQFLLHDGNLLQRMSGIAELLVGAHRADQHQAASDFFSMLGALPNAAELGFQLGKRIPVSAFGELGMGFRVAPTLREALQYNARFHRLLIPLLDYSYTESDSEGRFNIGFRCPIDGKGEAVVVAMVAAMGEREASLYSGRAGNLKAIECTVHSRGLEAVYRRHLALTPDTTHERNALVLDRVLLDLPNPSADPDTFEHLQSYANAQLEQRDVQLKLSGRVRERVMANIAVPPSLDHLAKSFGLTTRQLRVALTKEDTNYQEIVR